MSHCTNRGPGPRTTFSTAMCNIHRFVIALSPPRPRLFPMLVAGRVYTGPRRNRRLRGTVMPGTRRRGLDIPLSPLDCASVPALARSVAGHDAKRHGGATPDGSWAF